MYDAPFVWVERNMKILERRRREQAKNNIHQYGCYSSSTKTKNAINKKEVTITTRRSISTRERERERKSAEIPKEKHEYHQTTPIHIHKIRKIKIVTIE